MKFKVGDCVTVNKSEFDTHKMSGEVYDIRQVTGYLLPLYHYWVKLPNKPNMWFYARELERAVMCEKA